MQVNISLSYFQLETLQKSLELAKPHVDPCTYTVNDDMQDKVPEQMLTLVFDLDEHGEINSVYPVATRRVGNATPLLHGNAALGVPASA